MCTIVRKHDNLRSYPVLDMLDMLPSLIIINIIAHQHLKHMVKYAEESVNACWVYIVEGMSKM